MSTSEGIFSIFVTTTKVNIENPYLDYLNEKVGFDPITVRYQMPGWYPQYQWMPSTVEAVKDHESLILNSITRDWLTHKYSWAIPNESAIRRIAGLSPIVEIGAGTGYWAWMLSQAGADVIAYDKYPAKGLDPWIAPTDEEVDRNVWHKNQNPFFPVQFGEPPALRQHAQRTLFLCWPPGDDPFADECLSYFRGDNLVYVGWDGATGAEGFLQRLYEEFTTVEIVDIPQWSGIRDHCFIMKRIGVA